MSDRNHGPLCEASGLHPQFKENRGICHMCGRDVGLIGGGRPNFLRAIAPHHAGYRKGPQKRLKDQLDEALAKIDRLARALATTNPWLRTYPDEPTEDDSAFLACRHCFAHRLWVEVGQGIWDWEDERHNPECDYLYAFAYTKAMEDQ